MHEITTKRFNDDGFTTVEEADHQDREAKEYVLAYKGTFEFLLEIKSRFADDMFYELSPNQVAAILRCKANESRQPRPESGIDLSTLPTGSHHYAVTNSDGNTTFLRIDVVPRPSDWEGWIFVKQVIGGGNEQRLGKQKPGDHTYEGLWPDLIKQVLDDPNESMARFGRELGHCGWCGKSLTDATSRAIGIGPVCREGMSL